MLESINTASKKALPKQNKKKNPIAMPSKYKVFVLGFEITKIFEKQQKSQLHKKYIFRGIVPWYPLLSRLQWEMQIIS